MELDVLSLVTELDAEGDRARFEVDPNTMYPAVIEHIKARIAGSNNEDGVIRSRYFPQAAELPPEAWQLALLPRDEITGKKQIELRAQALELARVWFTELLHRIVRWRSVGVSNAALLQLEPPAEIAAAMRVRILKDERWRL